MAAMKKGTGYKFTQLASHMTGFSFPIFGVSWQAPEPQRKIIRELLVFLEDRRVLYNPYSWEVEHEVIDSVMKIREALTSAISRLADNAQAVLWLRAMRIACRTFLDSGRKPFHGDRSSVFLELGELRALFGTHIAYLAVHFGIDLEADLASVVPHQFTQDDDPEDRMLDGRTKGRLSG
jgi:hypothetical protein